MEVHGGLGRAGGTGGKTEQRDIVPTGFHRAEPHRFLQRQLVQLGVVVAGAIKGHDAFEKPAPGQAGLKLVDEAAVAQRVADFGLVDDVRQFDGAQHRHGVDHHRPDLGCGKPTGHHRRVVGRAHQDAIARLHAHVIDQHMSDAVTPVGELFVGAAAAVTDQRRVVTEASLAHHVSQLDTDVDVFGVVELPQHQLGPECEWRQVVA